jgi:hypothetical protein
MFTNFNKNIMGPISSNLSITTDNLAAMARDVDKFEKAYTNKLAGGLGSMIEKINSITKDLSTLDPNNFGKARVQLKRAADNLGLKGTEQLKVAFGDLKINVNIEVLVDSEELEKALLKRTDSKFATK